MKEGARFFRCERPFLSTRRWERGGQGWGGFLERKSESSVVVEIFPSRNASRRKSGQGTHGRRRKLGFFGFGVEGRLEGRVMCFLSTSFSLSMSTLGFLWRQKKGKPNQKRCLLGSLGKAEMGRGGKGEAGFSFLLIFRRSQKWEKARVRLIVLFLLDRLLYVFLVTLRLLCTLIFLCESQTWRGPFVLLYVLPLSSDMSSVCSVSGADCQLWIVM